MRRERTGAEGFQGGAVVLLDPLVSVLEQEADGRRGAVKLVDLQSLDRLPVPACQPQITQSKPVSQLAQVSLASELSRMLFTDRKVKC